MSNGFEQGGPEIERAVNSGNDRGGYEGPLNSSPQYEDSGKSTGLTDEARERVNLYLKAMGEDPT